MTKTKLLPLATFFALAFALTFAVNAVPLGEVYGVDSKGVLCGLGPLVGGLICYKIFATPNRYQISFRGIRPLVTYGVVALAVVLPVLLTTKLPKSALVTFTLTQLLYCLGEEFGWRHYLQNLTADLNKWLAALVIGTCWFFWHFSFISDPIHVLLGQRVPLLVGVPLCIVLLSLLSLLFGDLVTKTRSVLLPTVGHAITKFSNPALMGILFLVLVSLQIFWKWIGPPPADKAAATVPSAESPTP